ncbi:hypothetical protein DPMN_002130 [Dreissena polymorpha]|uniref:Uncharacterized protein n=1 Tax=Dreissena polymorpha TaxID=45954 RepID=A0A9D4MKP3_DREPO|nr:hypothetical protein DPMN_002130 [Dreissena polymorpha]
MYRVIFEFMVKFCHKLFTAPPHGPPEMCFNRFILTIFLVLCAPWSTSAASRGT